MRKEIYRAIVTVLAILSGISVGLWLIFMPAAQTAIKDPVTEEYFEMLQNTAMDVARTLDVEIVTDETLTADFSYKENEIVVTIKSFKATVIAHIPISNNEFNIEEGEVVIHGIAEFEKVEFENAINLQPAWWYMVESIIVGALVAFAVWEIFFKLWRK